MISDKITSFFFFKEDEVAINEKSIFDTLKYLSIIIKKCYIYIKKKPININTFKEMV